jgi:hypothetical protein
MALVLKDRIKETTTTTGTGTITLAGAVSGFQAFSVVGDGNTTYYTIAGGSEWEVGIGTYTSSGTTLSRDTILESSNSGSAVNFSAGTKDVFVTYPAERSVYLDAGSILRLQSYAEIKELLETATITASAPSATTNFDVITQAVQYYTSNASANFTLNIRGNSGTSLDSIMATGQSATITLLVTNGATAYYADVYQVDGSAVTPKWLGGAAPAAGNASGIDVYTFVVIKTASATFTVLASQSRFA